MSLKIAAAPTYELTLPSNKKVIKFRPFLVKEEKALLIAMQDKGDESIITTLKSVLNACTFNAISVDDLPTVDVEYLFLMLRNKSMGEGLDLEVTCSNCDKKSLVTCNLDTITVEGKGTNNTLELSNELKVTMKYPTLKMSYGLSADDIVKTIEIMARCIEFIEYQGKLFDTSELPAAEVIEFVEGMTQAQMKKIDEWIDNIPTVVFVDKFTCKHCQHENNIRIEGISDFFV